MNPALTVLSAIALLQVTLPAVVQAQARYRDEIFDSCQTLSNIRYGQFLTQPLYLDVYTGTGDTARNRPLVIFIHGGGFQTGDKATLFAKLTCTALARRGYVAASIGYRLSSSISNDTESFEAMLRALHDAKAAVRFFRKEGTLYGVDTSQIFVTGSSAGAITALHLAYLDSNEVPTYVDWSRVDSSFEGMSGNAGFSSRVQGVISNWGAIGDTAWIKKGDVPVFCVHGTADSLVRYNLIPAYGPFRYSSKYIIMAAQEKGIDNGLRLFVGAGHELDGDTVKQDSAIQDFSAWLSTILKRTTTSVTEASVHLPTSITLDQNYPNPFNPSTTIQYTVAGVRNQASGVSEVRIVIYDVLGRAVATLVNGRQAPGTYEVKFDGSRLPSGVYFCHMTAGSFTQVRRMILTK